MPKTSSEIMVEGGGSDGLGGLGDWGRSSPMPPPIVFSPSSTSPCNFFSPSASGEIEPLSLSHPLSSVADGQAAGEAAVGGEASGGREEKGGLSGIDETVVSGGFSEWKAPVAGSIAERRAARSGFNAARLNTARFRTASPLSSPAIRSPYLTIPPGLSPTTLLDSPVMLPNSHVVSSSELSHLPSWLLASYFCCSFVHNSVRYVIYNGTLGSVLQAQLSPTTGTFPGASIDQSPISVLASDASKDEQLDDIELSSFAFKLNNSCPSSFGNQQNMEIILDVQSEAQVQMQPQVEIDSQAACAEKESTNDSLASMGTSSSGIEKNSSISFQSLPVKIGHEEASQHEEQVHLEDSGPQSLADGDLKGSFPPTGLGRLSEDGYNWRKYGQKQVKGSEYPRSYYKCTHPNCQVKKKVERSHDGQITEIIYKGTHNHPKPQPSRRSAIGSAFALNDMTERPESAVPLVKVEGCSMWRGLQQQGTFKDVSDGDWRCDGIERTSSTSGVTDISDPCSTAQGKQLNQIELSDAPELSSTLASDNEDEDEEDRVTQGSISLGDDDNNEESESKRRKKEGPIIEANLTSRAVREPRVVVQTTSDIDILDDGYRWRKYGQKVVKGNPNPRSYYKCTNPGCSVRKHVERASHDIKSVITTYEGKHNHEVPAARSSSSGCSGSASMGASGVAAQQSLALPMVSGLTKPEPRMDGFAPRFEPSEYLKAASYLRNLTGDIKLGVSPSFDMKLPSLQSMPCTSFGLNAGNIQLHPLVPLAQAVSNFPGPLQMGMQRSASLSLPNALGFNPAKVMGPVQPYLGQQQSREGDVRLLRPKEEQKDDTFYDSRFDTSHPPSVYNQIMGRFPL
ncbi:putative WRKY transcription factor 2 [Nymphaea thermarum]|nr:putative WRKY transcription factor 2 [Nymphaea thermarum]